MYPFDTSTEYFNKKGKVMDDKTVPEFLVSLKISKKHIDTAEMRDKIMREAIDELILYFSLMSRNVTFPEYFVPIGVFFRKFKKNCQNPSYCKIIGNLLETIRQNEDLVLKKRSEIKNLQFVQGFD